MVEEGERVRREARRGRGKERRRERVRGNEKRGRVREREWKERE